MYGRLILLNHPTIFLAFPHIRFPAYGRQFKTFLYLASVNFATTYPVQLNLFIAVPVVRSSDPAISEFLILSLYLIPNSIRFNHSNFIHHFSCYWFSFSPLNLTPVKCVN